MIVGGYYDFTIRSLEVKGKQFKSISADWLTTAGLNKQTIRPTERKEYLISHCISETTYKTTAFIVKP